MGFFQTFIVCYGDRIGKRRFDIVNADEVIDDTHQAGRHRKLGICWLGNVGLQFLQESPVNEIWPFKVIDDNEQKSHLSVIEQINLLQSNLLIRTHTYTYIHMHTHTHIFITQMISIDSTPR